MTHFKVAVVLPSKFNSKKYPLTEQQIREEVERLLRPYDENDEALREGSRWDYWMVGGRWDGDILGLEWLNLKEKCHVCKGTGVRLGGLKEFGQGWYDGCNGCNGCNGTGKSAVWPSHDHYTTLDRNRCLVDEISIKYTMIAFISPDGEWHESTRMGWFGSEIEDEEGRTKDDKEAEFDQAWAKIRSEFGDNLVVSVDCHV